MQTPTKRILLIGGFLVLRFLFGRYGELLAAEPSKAAWQAEWEKTVKAAEQEGQLNFYSNGGTDGTLVDFQKRFPNIKVVLAPGRGGQVVSRLMAERRGGKYIADVIKLGTGSAVSIYRSRPVSMQPLDSSFVLPEVTDKSKWWQGKHHYVDPEGKYIFSPCISQHIDLVSYNTELVKPTEIHSYWDILNPRWKGKIVSLDPRSSGGREGGRLIYYHPELGPQFFKRLLSETDIALSQDPRQAVDWLAQGKFAFLLLTSPRELTTAKEKGLPVNILDPRNLKESPVLETAASNMSLMDKAPHPNAAKVFVNWLFSREGQISFQKSQGACDSARIDIPKDDVPPIHRRREGVKYFRVWDLEWMDVDEVRKFIDESLKEPQKG